MKVVKEFFKKIYGAGLTFGDETLPKMLEKTGLPEKAVDRVAQALNTVSGGALLATGAVLGVAGAVTLPLTVTVLPLLAAFTGLAAVGIVGVAFGAGVCDARGLELGLVTRKIRAVPDDAPATAETPFPAPLENPPVVENKAVENKETDVVIKAEPAAVPPAEVKPVEPKKEEPKKIVVEEKKSAAKERLRFAGKFLLELANDAAPLALCAFAAFVGGALALWPVATIAAAAGFVGGGLVVWNEMRLRRKQEEKLKAEAARKAVEEAKKTAPLPQVQPKLEAGVSNEFKTAAEKPAEPVAEKPVEPKPVEPPKP